jgi:hypothetical protein
MMGEVVILNALEGDSLVKPRASLQDLATLSGARFRRLEDFVCEK